MSDQPKVGDLIVDGEHLIERIAWGDGEGIVLARALNPQCVHKYVCWWVADPFRGDGWTFFTGEYSYGESDIAAWDHCHKEFVRRVGLLRRPAGPARVEEAKIIQ